MDKYSSNSPRRPWSVGLVSISCVGGVWTDGVDSGLGKWKCRRAVAEGGGVTGAGERFRVSQLLWCIIGG